jgi:hypothetical protein
MCNIIAFRASATSRDTSTVSASATEYTGMLSRGDGVAFATAARNNWLSPRLSDLAERLQAAIRTVRPEFAALGTGLSLAFVEGFASQLADLERSDTILTIEQSLTTRGLAADTFYWRNDTSPSEFI